MQMGVVVDKKQDAVGPLFNKKIITASGEELEDDPAEFGIELWVLLLKQFGRMKGIQLDKDCTEEATAKMGVVGRIDLIATIKAVAGIGANLGEKVVAGGDGVGVAWRGRGDVPEGFFRMLDGFSELPGGKRFDQVIIYMELECSVDIAEGVLFAVEDNPARGQTLIDVGNDGQKAPIPLNISEDQIGTKGLNL